MRFKKQIIITLFLLCICMIGAVSASSDTNDTLSSDLSDTQISHSVNSQIDKTSSDDI